ncbi:MAG: MBL fold metallo-hydrolase, partial [Bacilli bacterium]|nr:MBL fold metallo-hydrolase [Bacilli bacterium]
MLQYLVPLCLAWMFRLLPWQGGTGLSQIEGIVIFRRENYFILQVGLARYYVYEKGCTREIGDFLLLYGKSEIFLNTTYEGRFDFASYLYQKGVVNEFHAKSIETRFSMPLRLHEAESSFLSHFSADAQGLLGAVLFNDKDYGNEAIGLAASLSLSGVLSTSGLLYGSALRLLEKLVGLKAKEKTASLLTLIFAFLYLPFGILTVGVWRVFLTRFFRFLFLFSKKREKQPAYVCTSLAGLTLLLIDYRLCYETSFLLGFGASFLFSFSAFLPKKGIKGKLSALLLLFFFLLPSSFAQGAVHPFALLFSLLLLPFSLLFAFLGMASFLSVPFVSLLNGYASFLVVLLKGLKNFDVSFSFLPLSNYGILLYYLVLLFSFLLLEAKMKRLQLILSLGVCSLYLVGLLPIVPAFTSSVSFLNVGQGDCILIQNGLHAVMIDTGGVSSFDMAEEVLIPYLKRRRIYKLDALIITHGDFDHMGASESLRNHFQASSTIDGKDSFPLTVGKMRFENLNTFDIPSSEENDKSLVIKFSLMGKVYLFMGDAPISVEKMILERCPDLDCDILKLGHHGSDNSTSEAFLDQVTPEEAIISCG